MAGPVEKLAAQGRREQPVALVVGHLTATLTLAAVGVRLRRLRMLAGREARACWVVAVMVFITTAQVQQVRTMVVEVREALELRRVGVVTEHKA
jgi:hypothetical protein